MNMRKLVVLLCVVFIGASSFAYTLMGPPTAELKMTPAEKVKYPYKQTVYNLRENHMGYIYSFSKMDIGIAGSVVAEDVELTRHYFTWGMALDQNFNFNVLVGAVSGDMDNSDLGSTNDFDGDNGFSAGANLKCTFSHGPVMDWGFTVQATYFSTEDTVNFAGTMVDLDLSDAYDIQVAVGPTFKMTDSWKLYGGAYYYMLDGDLDVEIPAGNLSGSTSIDEEDEFGAFIGTQFKFADNMDLIVEYQQGNDSQQIGFSLGMTF